MRTFPLFLLLCTATALTSQAQLQWMVGRDDNGYPVGDGGGPNTTFVQENAVINPLPGSPSNPEVNQQSDNDYYFSGIYSTVIPGNSAFYGPYAPIGLVGVNEEGAERAFAAGDLDLRYHFNLAGSLQPIDTLTVTFDATNLDDLNATNFDPRFGIEIYFNSVLVQPQIIIRPAQIDQDFTTAQFTLASVNAQTGPGADNIVSLRGISYNGAPGGGNWMGIDYVQLDAQVVPEPSTAMMLLFGAMGAVPFLRRRCG